MHFGKKIGLFLTGINSIHGIVNADAIFVKFHYS